MEINTLFSDEQLIDQILTQYRNGKITIGRVAEMADLPLREMIAIAAKKGIPFQYSLDDLREDLLAAESLCASSAPQ